MAGSLRLQGPMEPSDSSGDGEERGIPVMRARLPIFVATSGGEEGAHDSLGLPDSLNAGCGSVCYDLHTGRKLWGFVSDAGWGRGRGRSGCIMVNTQNAGTEIN